MTEHEARIDALQSEVRRLRAAIAQAVADIRQADQESVTRRDYDAAVDVVVKRLTVALAQRGEA